MDQTNKRMEHRALHIKNIRRYDTQCGALISGSVTCTDGIIAAIDQAAPADCEICDGGGLCLVPGLVDAHTHGRIGFDFDSAGEDEMRQMQSDYYRVGTTTPVPTIASAPFDQICEAIAHIRACRFRAAHLEGRYLNPKRRGAHRTDLLHEPDTAELRELLACRAEMPFHITMAPELPGGDAFLAMALKAGATVSLGHSDATYEQARCAFDAGVSGVSHLCNALAPIHHRMPGSVVAALTSEKIYTEIICDGLHVHPGMIQMIAQLKDEDHLVLITDSMSATGCPDGEYAIAGQKVFVRNGRAENAEGALAGSTINLFEGLKNFMRFCHVPLERAIRYATVNPARMLGIDDRVGAIAPGLAADFLLLDERTMKIHTVFVAGNAV